MSETTNETETKTAAVVLPTLEVVRNDTPVKYVSASKKRGAAEGSVYYAPDPVLTLETVIKHIGADDVLSMIMSRWNLQAQRWMVEASLTDGKQPKPFDVTEFIGYATSFSARGLTIAALNEEISKLTDALNEFLFTEEFLAITNKDERKAAIEPRINRIKELKLAVAQRKS